MAVTFGTRSAMRDLAEELSPTEQVVELAACTYAGASGLVALTDERVIAIRDDYTKHQVQSMAHVDMVTIDYNPTVHDGFAMFSADGRLVVRKMQRSDGDRLVDQLLIRAPHIALDPSVPGATPPPGPQPRGERAPGQATPAPALGRHRAPSPVVDVLDDAGVAPAVEAQAGAAQAATLAAQRTAGALPGQADTTSDAASLAAPGAISDAAGSGRASGNVAGTTAGNAAGSASRASTGLAAVPGAVAVAPARVAPPVADGEATPAVRSATDKEVLLGVLADLHTQGLLTAEEFSLKVRQVMAQP